MAVLIDFENLVIGATEELPEQSNAVPYGALARLCSEYGNASIRRAYANWANHRFGAHQEDLAMNGVDLIQIPRFGMSSKNAADIRITVDAMETLITHPNVAVFILVTGDSDYSPLVQRLREFGKWVVGVGTQANASRRLVSICSEYKFWGTLVAEFDPAARRTRDAAFDISAAEQLMLNAFKAHHSGNPTAAALKNRMLTLDPSFDEHNYGFSNFREFLNHFPEVVEQSGVSGGDITVRLTPG